MQAGQFITSGLLKKAGYPALLNNPFIDFNLYLACSQTFLDSVH